MNSLSKDEAETMQTLHVAEHSYKLRHVFPLVYRTYNLTLCAPLSVAKNERSFSRLKKIVNNFQRSKCGDDRLDSLMLLYCEADIAADDRLDSVMLLYCEADITMDLNLDILVDNWAKIRHRGIEI